MSLLKELNEVVDTLFNKRPAVTFGPADTKVTHKGISMGELIKRGSSVVLHNGKTYRVVVTEVHLTARPD